MADYFTSDWHYNHVAILSFERQDCVSITEHNNKIMKPLEQLSSTDRVFCLGDCGDVDDELALRLRKVKATMILILGNHDKKTIEFYKEQCGFKEVYYGCYWYTKRIVLSHEPMMVESGILNVHGHLHNSYLSLPNYLNVNVYLSGYQLVHLKKIMSILSTLEKPQKVVFLKEWYAPYYRFIRQRPDLVLNEDMTINLEASLNLRGEQQKPD